jgi:hypothetical protein
MHLIPGSPGVNTPWRKRPVTAHYFLMKQYKLPRDQMSGGKPRQTAAATSDFRENEFTPAPDEVARRAYFSYQLCESRFIVRT